jgi:WD40 repeat protein
VGSVALSGDGRTAISGGRDHTVRVWDLGLGRCSAVLEGHTDWVGSVALSGDGRTAISGGDDGTVRVWDLRSGRCAAALEGHTASVGSVAVSGDGRTAISGGDDHTVRVWDVHSRTCRLVFPCDNDIRAVALTAQSPWIVCAGDSAGNVVFFEIKGLT